VFGGDPEQIFIGRVGAHTLEKHPDLHLPPTQVGAEDSRLLFVRELPHRALLAVAAQLQDEPVIVRADIAHPLRVPAWRDEVLVALEGEQVDRCAAGGARSAPAHLEHPAPPDADAHVHRQDEERVHDPARQRTGFAVVGGRFSHYLPPFQSSSNVANTISQTIANTVSHVKEAQTSSAAPSPKLPNVRVGVAGSSGLIGRALCAHLEEAGHEVTRVLRRPVRPGEQALQWDPAAGTIDRDGLEGLDAVVNLAGAGIGDRRWSPARKQLVLDSRTRATALIARTVAELAEPPCVLLNASAIGFYGDRGELTVTEQTGPGSDFLATVCQLWESAAAPAAEAGTRVAFPRSGMVLSPRGGALAKLIPLFRAGLGGRLGTGSQWWSWITLDDEVAALIWLLENDVRGPVNLASPNPVTNRDFAVALAQAVSRPAWVPVPRFGPRVLLGTELADSLLFTSARIRPAVLEAGGYRFKDPDLETGLRRMLRPNQATSGRVDDKPS
jgi:uncharacterized protein